MRQYFKNIYEAITTILIGMGVTFGHLFTRSVTLQYPHERHTLPKGSRQQLFVDMDRCEGCRQCERACPVNCIDIDTIKVRKDEDAGVLFDGSKRRLHVVKFDIDMAKCCYCNLCTFPCPTDAIYMTPEYEFSTYDRNSLLKSFAVYSPERVAELRERDRLEKEAAAAAKAAAAPALPAQAAL